MNLTLIFITESTSKLKHYRPTVHILFPSAIFIGVNSSSFTGFPICLLLQKFFRRKSARDLLPAKPVEISVEPWWVAQAGFITEDDIRVRYELCSFSSDTC